MVFYDIETTGTNTCRDKIIAIGFMSERDEEPIVSVGEEKYIIGEFLRYLKEIEDKYGKVVLVGWKIKSFDVPFVVMRSLVNNIDKSLLEIFLRAKIHDLAEMADRYLTIDTQRPTSREFFGVFGIEHDEEILGSDVPSLYKVRKMDRIAEHCRRDIIAIKGLWERLRPLITMTDFQPKKISVN